MSADEVDEPAFCVSPLHEPASRVALPVSGVAPPVSCVAPPVSCVAPPVSRAFASVLT